MPTYVKIIGWCIFALAAWDIFNCVAALYMIERVKRMYRVERVMRTYAVHLAQIETVYIIGWLIAVWEYAG